MRMQEPIAIIGIGCRFPGCNGASGYWELLARGADAIRVIPPDRWDIDAYYDPDVRTPGKMNTRWAGLIDDVHAFDRRFFGIRPREAARMDVQQRVLLEVAYECLEDAGTPLKDLDGARVGVFMGVPPGDHGRAQMSRVGDITPFTATGTLVSVAANRISYLLNLRGPSLALDTACSSSLVSIHLACQSLRAGECEMALAGGVNIILSPDVTVAFSKAGALSPSGRCRAFDAGADGYVRAEGAGVVLLKPLERALADTDRIYAVIAGSAVNQDGRTNGLTAPSPRAQEEVLGAACRSAGVHPGDVQYVETHGTGTLLGDPMEAKALAAVVCAERPAAKPCRIGSVKTNIGHLETAAGVASLVKLALSIAHRQLPPSLHFHAPNPRIPFKDLKLRVQTELGPWPESETPGPAGVSAFGFGGTNAHAVLAPAPPVGLAPRPRRARYLLPLSARSREALARLARAYRMLADTTPWEAMYDLCYTASLRRNHFEHRAAAVFRSRRELAGALERLAERAEMETGPAEAHGSAPESRLARAYTSGERIDWSTLYPTAGRCISLPAYPWERTVQG